jgi:phage replication-related protein YjqB (UPF0714/DUF867 family)
MWHHVRGTCRTPFRKRFKRILLLPALLFLGLLTGRSALGLDAPRWETPRSDSQPVVSAMNEKNDTYHNYEELKRTEREGVDYRISVQPGDLRIAIVALHGGGIEPGTSELALALAGGKYACYSFDGIKPKGNAILHITSTHFDEPLAVSLVQRAHTVVAVHGCGWREEAVVVGGRNLVLCEEIKKALRASGFTVKEEPRLAGKNRRNLGNRCMSGQGVQLEITRALRARMFEDLTPQGRRVKTATFERFVKCLGGVLDAYARGIPEDRPVSRAAQGR